VQGETSSESRSIPDNEEWTRVRDVAVETDPSTTIVCIEEVVDGDEVVAVLKTVAAVAEVDVIAATVIATPSRASAFLVPQHWHNTQG
jgi:hypothetical protein